MKAFTPSNIYPTALDSIMALASNPKTVHRFFWVPFVVVGERGQAQRKISVVVVVTYCYMLLTPVKNYSWNE